MCMGHCSATIAGLLDAGWTPTLPHQRTSPDGGSVATPAGNPSDREQIIEAFRDSVSRQAWEQAPTHYLSLGPEEGPLCFDPTRRAHQKLCKQR